MKTSGFIFVFLCICLSMSAQVPSCKFIGDTLGPWCVINFEEPTEFIHVNATSQNIWQTGPPQKPLFNQAYSVPNAMITDTLNFYPANNHSSFDLYIGGFNTNWSYFYDLFISFRHKFDTDTLRDGGYITVSWDHGQSWMNILDDTISTQYFFASPAHNWGMWGNTSLYTSTDTLYNGEQGFSGTSNGWLQSCMAWYNIPVKHPAEFPPDTVILRFNFISDNIHNNKEGWMIDDIRIFSIDLGSGINERMTETLKFRVTPNAVTTNALVILDHFCDKVEYLLMDLSGRIVSEGKPGKCSEFEIRRSDISPGIYLLKVTGGAGRLSSVCRIVLL
jgi:hypothetical protein